MAETEKQKKLQWHPAFFAGIQIELEEERDKLIFENEHQLTTKPLGVDVVIIKKIVKFDEGIYHISGDMFPIQIIHTAKLSKETNFWLKNLTNDLKRKEEVECLLNRYNEKKQENLYQSVMDVIVKANIELFEEVKDMCDALMELVKPQVEAKVQAARAEERESVKSDLIRKMLSKNKSVEEIADLLEESVETVQKLMKAM